MNWSKPNTSFSYGTELRGDHRHPQRFAVLFDGGFL
jgi:hypothetical protein